MSRTVELDRRTFIREIATGAALLGSGAVSRAAAETEDRTRLVILGSMAGPSVGAARYKTDLV
jgi:hypothetical protein